MLVNWTAPLGLSQSDELVGGDMMYAAYTGPLGYQVTWVAWGEETLLEVGPGKLLATSSIAVRTLVS